MTDDSNDRIALSRLLAGDLPTDEARSLRARIDHEPDLARMWRELGSLLEDLEDLSDTPPPPDLDADVLAARLEPDVVPMQTGARQPWSIPAAAGWVLAAALLLALALPFARTPSTTTLLEGRQLVEGTAMIATPAGQVQVDGIAVVDVEPPVGALRRAPVNPTDLEVPMNPTHLLSAATGAVLTVTVLQGSAYIWPDGDAPPVELSAGETHRTGPSATPMVNRSSDPIDKPAAVAKLDPEVAAWVEQLETENAALRFENTLVKGQLDAHQGVPLDWPADLAEPATPEAFTAHAEAIAAAVPELDLQDVRCEEYPCIAVFTGSGTEDELKGDIVSLHQALKERIPDESEVSTLISAGISNDSDDPDADAALTIGVAAMDTNGDEPSDAEHDRIQQRMRGIEDEIEGTPEP